MRRLALLLLAACRTVPPAPDSWVEVPTQAPVFDAGDGDGLGTDLGDACFHLRVLGCPEGTPLATGRTCYQHLMALSAMADVPVACLKAAGSQDDVRHCGDAKTLRFRCVP